MKTFSIRTYVVAVLVGTYAVAKMADLWWDNANSIPAPRWLRNDVVINGSGERLMVIDACWFKDRPRMWHTKEGWWYRVLPEAEGHSGNTNCDYVHESKLTGAAP